MRSNEDATLAKSKGEVTQEEKDGEKEVEQKKANSKSSSEDNQEEDKDKSTFNPRYSLVNSSKLKES